MICELCQHNPSADDSFVCEDCTKRELKEYDGKPVDPLNAHLQCRCDDEMCEFCKAFQEYNNEIIERELKVITHQEEI